MYHGLLEKVEWARGRLHIDCASWNKNKHSERCRSILQLSVINLIYSCRMKTLFSSLYTLSTSVTNFNSTTKNHRQGDSISSTHRLPMSDKVNNTFHKLQIRKFADLIFLKLWTFRKSGNLRTIYFLRYADLRFSDTITSCGLKISTNQKIHDFYPYNYKL